MDDRRAHPSAKTLAFSRQQLCDEILSWMIEMWMNNPMISDSICNTITLQSPRTNLQGMTNNVGLTFRVGNTIPQFTIRTGTTNNYHI